MRMVELHLDADRPVHLELHERLTVVVAEDQLGRRIADLLRRAYVLAGGEVTGTVDGGGFLTPFDPTAVVALALDGEGLRTLTRDDLPPPDPGRRAQDRERAEIELNGIGPELELARAELERARRVHDATVAAAAAGNEELETSRARLDDLVAATAALEDRPPELARERGATRQALEAAEARIAELRDVRAGAVTALGDPTLLRSGDDLSAVVALADRAVGVGGLGPVEHAAITSWCGELAAGTAPVHPTAQALIDESAELEAAWERAASAGVEGDPGVVAALTRRDSLAQQRELLDGLARSGLLGDTARAEIEHAHTAVLAAGRDRDAAVAAEDEALARYGFDSHLDFTIATSTRTVGQKAEAKLRSVTAELQQAEQDLVVARAAAADHLERLAERREPIQERITAFLGHRPQGPAGPLLAAVPAVPDVVVGIGPALEDAVASAQDEAHRYHDALADLDEEERSLDSRRAELADQRSQLEARVREIEELLARVDDQVAAATARADAAAEATRRIEATRTAAERAIDELDDATDDVYTEQDLPTVLEAMLGRIDPWAPFPDPVLLDDALAPLGTRGVAAVLEALVARADRTQLLYLTDDQGVRAWAESLDPAVGRCVVLTRSRWMPRRLRRSGRARG